MTIPEGIRNIATKMLVVIVLISIPVIATGFMLMQTSEQWYRTGEDIFDWATSVFLIAGLVMLTINGTTYRTGYFPFIVICLLLTQIPILHLLDARISAPLSFFGLVGLAVLYPVAFGKKQSKGIIDHLKLIWVLVCLVSAFFRILHLMGTDMLFMFQEVLFVGLVAEFLVRHFRTNVSRI